MTDETIWFIIWIVAFILFVWCWRSIKKLIRQSREREAMSQEVEQQISKEQ